VKKGSAGYELFGAISCENVHLCFPQIPFCADLRLSEKEWKYCTSFYSFSPSFGLRKIQLNLLRWLAPKSCDEFVT